MSDTDSLKVGEIDGMLFRTIQGKGVMFFGGGFYISSIWARQNVTVVAAEKEKILGVAIANPEKRGSPV